MAFSQQLGVIPLTLLTLIIVNSLVVLRPCFLLVSSLLLLVFDLVCHHREYSLAAQFHQQTCFSQESQVKMSMSFRLSPLIIIETLAMKEPRRQLLAPNFRLIFKGRLDTTYLRLCIVTTIFLLFTHI